MTCQSLGQAPDLIHGQHHLETMTALAMFPGTPALYACHGCLPWQEAAPVHPRILRYLAVNEAVRDRLVFEAGVSPDKITIALNFVDLEQFLPRPALPAKPGTALIFSNYASEANYVGRHSGALRAPGHPPRRRRLRQRQSLPDSGTAAWRL